MSCIPGFEESTEDAFDRFYSTNKVNRVRSTEITLD